MQTINRSVQPHTEQRRDDSLKVLMVTPMPPRTQAPGAIPLVLHAQLTGLINRHHDVTLLTVVGQERSEREAVETLRASGIEVHAVPLMVASGIPRWQRRWRLATDWLTGRYPWRSAWFRAPAIQEHLDRILAEQQFDVIQVEDNSMGMYEYGTCVPTVLTEHEVRRPRPIDWRGCTRQNWLKWLLGEIDWRRWERYQPAVWRRFDRIQVFTTRDADAVHEVAPDVADRVRVNPYGVEVPEPSPPEAEEEGTVLFVGNFTHEPNVDAALWLGREIMPRLRRLRSTLRLFVVGPHPPKSVQALAGDDVIVTDRVPDVEPFVARAAVVLAPIRIGGGMRMKVLHAMALGKAVVTTPRGVEGLTEGGRRPPLVIAEDVDEIACETAVLLQSAAARRDLGRRARAFVAQHHSPAAYARRLKTVYAELQRTEGQ